MGIEQIPNNPTEPSKEQPSYPGWILENGIWKKRTKEEDIELTNQTKKNDGIKEKVEKKEEPEKPDEKKIEEEERSNNKNAEEKQDSKNTEINKKENEITENFYDELKKIKSMPNKARRSEMEKTEKYFQLIENWQDLAYLDNYKGIKNIFSELDKLKPSIFLYNFKKAQIANNVSKSMALNYKEWKVEDKEKLKIIKNFVKGQSKDKTLKEIAQILASNDIPFKNNIDVIVKEIENPNIKAETISEMIDIEKGSIEKKKQSLQDLKEDMKRDKLPPDKMIKEQLKNLGVNLKAASEILPKLGETLENPEVQKEFEKLSKTKEFQKFKDAIEEVTKGKDEKEIPDAVKKTKEHIKDEKKESFWKTAFGVTGSSILLFLVLFMLAELEGVEILSDEAGGRKKK